MKSESVWFEEVDTALVEYLKNVFPNVKVLIRKPDMDFSTEVYPCISIYAKGYTKNNIRHNHDMYSKTRTEDKKFIVVEKSSIPYDLSYQIDFWANTQNDMNYLTRVFLGGFDRHINLDVFDVSGNKRNILCRQSSGIIKSDLLNGTDRIFHTIVEFTVWVELDERISRTEPTIRVTEIKKIKL